MGGYEAADAAHDQVEAVYPAVARLIGCRPDEIAVVKNATRAWDMAFYSLSFNPGDRILTARAEYATNVIAFLQVAKRTGAVVEVIEDDEHGQFSVADLKDRLEHGEGDVRLIAMTHVPTQGGLVNPAEEVGAVARHPAGAARHRLALRAQADAGPDGPAIPGSARRDLDRARQLSGPR